MHWQASGHSTSMMMGWFEFSANWLVVAQELLRPAPPRSMWVAKGIAVLLVVLVVIVSTPDSKRHRDDS